MDLIVLISFAVIQLAFFQFMAGGPAQSGPSAVLSENSSRVSAEQVLASPRHIESPSLVKADALQEGEGSYVFISDEF